METFAEYSEARFDLSRGEPRMGPYTSFRALSNTLLDFTSDRASKSLMEIEAAHVSAMLNFASVS